MFTICFAGYSPTAIFAGGPQSSIDYVSAYRGIFCTSILLRVSTHHTACLHKLQSELFFICKKKTNETLATLGSSFEPGWKGFLWHFVSHLTHQEALKLSSIVTEKAYWARKGYCNAYRWLRWGTFITARAMQCIGKHSLMSYPIQMRQKEQWEDVVTNG